MYLFYMDKITKMKSMLNKAKKHWKKIIVHLKRHHRKYLFWIFCSVVLTLIGIHFANTVSNIFADGETLITLTADNLRDICKITDSEGFDWWKDINCREQNIGDIKKNTFIAYNKINRLDLSNNEISNLNWIHDSDKEIEIYALLLSWNNISEIYSGTFGERSFFKIQKDGIIDLSDNKISYIETESFSWLSLNVLNLYQNRLSTIDDKFYNNIRSLNELDLWYNEIIDISTWIMNIPDLQILWIDDNCLSSGEINTLTYVRNHTNINCDNLNYKCVHYSYHTIQHESGDYLLYTWKQNVCFQVNYQPNTLTTWLVTAELTLTGSVPNNLIGQTFQTWFEENWTKYFKFTGNFNRSRSRSGNLAPVTVTWIIPSCEVEYSETWLTNTGVIAYITWCNKDEFTVTNNRWSIEYTFTGNWSFGFNLMDSYNNRWTINATVDWIDMTAPTCSSVIYDTTSPTSWSVTATLTWCSSDIDITGSVLTHIFTWENESFTFNIKDLVGNTWTTGITVDWIDHTKPTCNISYEFQLTSWNHSTLAKLVNCSESWNVINNSGSTEYRFLSSGNFKFEFQDLVGNTWSTEAIVSYVKNSGDIISLYNANKALSCRHYYKSWNSSQDYKLYVTTWTMYLYLNTSIEGTGIDSHILLTDDKLYQWWSSYSQYFGSWEWVYQIYKFNMENELASFFNDEDFYFICYPWINDMSIFNVPSNVTFRTQGHYSANNGTFFSVSIDDTIKAWENTNFVVKIMKDWATFKGYTGTVYFELTDRNWNIVDRDLYEFSEGRHYKFDESDRWRKTFSVKIKKEWAYVLKLYDSDNEYIEWSEIITVKSNGSSSSFEYDTYKFNPKYSDEMNKAYQYSRYYNITTIDNIKDAWMTGWLNRIAMAKMLSNYAINVLGKNDFDRNRNCTFKDVSTSMDKDYDYWVTKACQLWIMWVNMPDNKFYPKWWVTRAEFATALSRLLYWTKDWTDKYYSTHITKLYREWIISNTDPKLWEKRWYIMLMLMRASENFGD